jgi:hypothetical protein
MANHFRETAEKLRQMAAAPRPPGAMDDSERQVLEHAAQVLCRLEQLKHDLIATAPVLDNTSEDDNGVSDRLVAELLSLLGLHTGS